MTYEIITIDLEDYEAKFIDECVRKGMYASREDFAIDAIKDKLSQSKRH